MRIFVTGGSGQLATDIRRHAESMDDDVVALDHRTLDVTDAAAVRAAVSAAAPDVVVNCAAYTAVDACETDEATALAINGTAVGHVGRAAAEVGARFIHLSTDYVFDGTKPSPYVETDRTNPRSAYGRTKLAGETEALAVPGSVVVRVAWLCGIHGTNMVKTVLGLRDRTDLAFVDDQRGSPTFTADVARTLRLLSGTDHSGVVHATNEGETTWYGFVREILEIAGADPGNVRPIATSALDPPRPAPRPANSVLDNAVLRASGLPDMPHYRDSLEQVVRTLLA